MKKALYKILIALIVILMLLEFVFNVNRSNAETKNATIGPDFINAVANATGGVVSIIYWPKRIELIGIAFIIDKTFYNLAASDDPDLGGYLNLDYLTPFQIFFNKYKLIDANVLDLATINESDNTISFTIRKNVSIWFYVMRVFSAAVLLAILVYIGIRMALSTIASDKARYKEMFIDWVVSLILIFVVHLIAVFIININNIIVGALESLSGDLVSLEDISKIYNEIALLATLGIGIPSITATIVYCAMVFMTIGFFIAYVNRMIKIAFLVIISPLISITYSIDKIKDQKAQALNTWLKEFIFTVLIQPFHCVMYLAFTNTAYRLLTPFLIDGDGALGNLKDIAGTFANTVIVSKDYNLLTTAVLVVISLIFIKKAEEVVRKIFGFTDTNKSTSFGAGLAMSVMAVSQAKNIGTATRKGINTAKSFAPNLSKAVSHDFNMLKNTGLGQKISTGLNSAGEAIGNSGAAKGLDKAITSFSNTGFARATGKLAGKTGKKITGFSQGLRGKAFKVTNSRVWKAWARKNSLASVIGSMYGISQLVNGDNIMEVYADSKAVEEGVQAFIGTADGKIADYALGAASELDDTEYKQKLALYHKQSSDPNKDPLEEAVKGLSDLKYSDGINSEEEFRKRVVTDKMAYGKGYRERSNDRKIEAKQIRDSIEAENKKNNVTEYTDEQKIKLKEAEELEEEAEELGKLADTEELMNQKDELANFYSLEAILARTENRNTPPGKSDFKKASEELKKEVLKLIQQRKSENNVDDGYVDEDDSKTAEALQKSLEEIIQSSVNSDKKINLDSLIKNSLDVSEKDDPVVFARMMEKTEQIRQLYLEKKVAESFSATTKNDGDEERYARVLSNKLRSKALSRNKK